MARALGAALALAAIAATLAFGDAQSVGSKPAFGQSKGLGRPEALGPRTKSSGCRQHEALPDRACTPGSIYPGATRSVICVHGYSSRVRNVPASVKDFVYAEYGIASHSPGEYEVDHLVPLEAGGSNSIANLFPEPARPAGGAPGFHDKDRLENAIHKRVCDGRMRLAPAQRRIARNWVELLHALGL